MSRTVSKSGRCHSLESTVEKLAEHQEGTEFCPRKAEKEQKSGEGDKGR